MGNPFTEAVRTLKQYPLYVVVLCPSAEVVATREAGRDKTGYTSFSPAAFDKAFPEETAPVGLWLDTSTLTVAETVEYILGHLSEARVV